MNSQMYYLQILNLLINEFISSMFLQTYVFPYFFLHFYFIMQMGGGGGGGVTQSMSRINFSSFG